MDCLQFLLSEPRINFVGYGEGLIALTLISQQLPLLGNIRVFWEDDTSLMEAVLENFEEDLDISMSGLVQIRL